MDHKVIDFTKFQEELNIDFNTLKELFLEFSDEINIYKNNINENVAMKNFIEVTKIIHDMIGLTGNFKANDLYQVVKQFNSVIKEGNEQQINSYLSVFNEEVDTTSRCIVSYFNQQ